MSTRIPKLPTFFATLVLAFLASGCLIGTSSDTKFTGRYIGHIARRAFIAAARLRPTEDWSLLLVTAPPAEPGASGM